MMTEAKTITAPDGTVWGVSIRGLSSSNAMVVHVLPVVSIPNQSVRRG